MPGVRHHTKSPGRPKDHHLDQPAEERESRLNDLPVRWGEDDGFRSRITPRSKWNVIELDCWADPRKTEEWAREMIATIGMQRFQREYLRNWSLSTQSPFYPEWTLRGGDQNFVRKITALAPRPIVIGLDFGFRHPALVVGQTNEKATRLYLLREWMPRNIGAGAFLEVAEWLLGEMAEEQLGTEAQRHVLDLRDDHEKGKGPFVPWFRRPPRVIRHTGPEALRTSQEVTNESQERRIVDIWANRGFPLILQAQSVKAGELVVRHLLRPAPPKADPFLIVDRSCKLIIEAMNGGYTFKRPTRDNPAPDQPAKDGYYEHVMDALRYLAAGCINPLKVDEGIDEKAPEMKSDPDRPVSARGRKDPGIYSRDNVKDDDDGLFSSPWDTTVGTGRRDVYTRGE
jgi:hypothetical protein